MREQESPYMPRSVWQHERLRWQNSVRAPTGLNNRHADAKRVDLLSNRFTKSFNSPLGRVVKAVTRVSNLASITVILLRFLYSKVRENITSEKNKPHKTRSDNVFYLLTQVTTIFNFSPYSDSSSCTETRLHRAPHTTSPTWRRNFAISRPNLLEIPVIIHVFAIRNSLFEAKNSLRWEKHQLRSARSFLQCRISLSIWYRYH